MIPPIMSQNYIYHFSLSLSKSSPLIALNANLWTFLSLLFVLSKIMLVKVVMRKGQITQPFHKIKVAICSLSLITFKVFINNFVFKFKNEQIVTKFQVSLKMLKLYGGLLLIIYRLQKEKIFYL